MRVLVIGFAKIKYMPYMNFYLDNIDRSANDVHLLYWNRDLLEEDTSNLTDATLHEFRCFQEDDVQKPSKLGSFHKYRRYAKGVIRNGYFDAIIVLHSLTSLLIADELKKYSGKYIFDYRDSTYESFSPFKMAIATLVKNSYATFVSSDAFRRFLPSSESAKIYTSHNLLIDSLSHRNEKELHGEISDKIRIAFWGLIRHEAINLEIIKKIASDRRFELHYYGREQQVALNLKQYVADNRVENVFFHGEYKPEDRYGFARRTDILHNIYHDGNTMLAMGNKYYDSAIFYIPQICMRGSFMQKQATSAGIGFACSPYDEHFTDSIFEYYTNLDQNEFVRNCDTEVTRFYDEYKRGAAIIKGLTARL